MTVSTPAAAQPAAKVLRVKRSKQLSRTENRVVAPRVPSFLVDILGSQHQAKTGFFDFDHDLTKQLGAEVSQGSLELELESNILALEKLVELLSVALARAKSPNASATSCVKFVQDGFVQILNPNKNLELELAALVTNRKSPVNESYTDFKNRMIYSGSPNKANPSGYFEFAFGKFYDAGILYKHHIRAMDDKFYNVMHTTKDPFLPRLPTKSDLIDNEIKLLDGDTFSLVLSRTRAAYRRKIT